MKKLKELCFCKVSKVFEKISDFFRNIKYGMRNLIKWTPVIWQDRDWDQWFLYKILHFKLQEMEKMQRNGIHLHREATADKIKVCKLLLKRLIDDDYLVNTLKNHEEKWGELEMKFVHFKNNSEYGEIEFKVENANTDEEKKEEDKARHRLYKHSDYLQKQDLDMLFKNMRCYIQGWWD